MRERFVPLSAMRRISLQTYFELAEKLERARTVLQFDKISRGAIYFRLNDVNTVLSAFVESDKAFSLSKHSANDFIESINGFFKNYLHDENGEISFTNFGEDADKWQYSHIVDKLESFKNVFVTECRDASIYLVEQLLIYNTSDLAEEASKRIPNEVRDLIPISIIFEFDQAGKAIAFDLPTACGFHVLRALEVMMEHYLSNFNYNGKKCSSWFDYIESMRKLYDDKDRIHKPSEKVISMLDRMRQLDRNPLMHPQDTLDTTQAETLFSLSAITIIEMARDLSAKEPVLSQGDLPLIPTLATPEIRIEEQPDPHRP